MKKATLITLSALLISLTASVGLRADEAQAKAAFEKLKGLAGNWEGLREGAGDEEAVTEAESAPDVTHIFRIASAGTVVMETMNPGGDEEMINMYHLDGNALMVTHYCAGGNQPAMLLNPMRSTEDMLYFELIGGTNFDPEVDPHIHTIEIALLGPDRITSVFDAYDEGKKVGTMTFELARN